jgi:PAS domain S-box-containing protein
MVGFGRPVFRFSIDLVIIAIRDSSSRPMSEPTPHLQPPERAVLESVPDVVYRYRVRPTPRFEYVSPSSTAVVGYTPEEHHADPDLARRIVHPDDMPLLIDATERLDPSAVYRIRWRHKDGRELITEQRLQPIYDRDGELVAIVGVARPVPRARGDRIISVGDIAVDLTAARAFVAGQRIELTSSEHRILALLVSADGEVSREELVEHLWGSYHSGGERAVQVHVSNLRRKLDPDKARLPRIETVRGVGYRLRPLREPGT